ncbi:MAG: HAD family hydrolase [Candidatus Bathyarchaeia archaeon]|jgi:HAD superfamily hydrolase (TIGR01509 family)
MHQPKFKAKAIFLDLDGTLVDSTSAYIEAAKIAFRSVGKIPPRTEVLLELPKRVEQYRSLDDITEGTTAEFLPVYFHAYHSITEKETKLLPNVEATLACLSAKAKLALITMRHVPNEVLQKELDTHGIAKYFTHIFTALDTDKPKPSPEALIRCVKALDIDMGECLMAGDSVNDLRAGKAAGTKTVAFLSGLYSREELLQEKPDLILPDISKLPEHIE